MLDRKRAQVVEAGGGMTIAEPGQPQTVMGLPGRTFERKQGCYNCKFWEAGELAAKHYSQCMIRDARALLDTGMPFKEVDKRIINQTRLMAPPKTGLCLSGGANAEFTMPGYLCERWTGRVAVEGKYDPLAVELRNKLGEDIE